MTVLSPVGFYRHRRPSSKLGLLHPTSSVANQNQVPFPVEKAIWAFPKTTTKSLAAIPVLGILWYLLLVIQTTPVPSSLFPAPCVLSLSYNRPTWQSFTNMDTSHPKVRPFWASYFSLAYINEMISLSGITALKPRTPLFLSCLKTALVAALEEMGRNASACRLHLPHDGSHRHCSLDQVPPSLSE